MYMALVNAYVVYKETHDKYVPLLDFHREVAQRLLTLGKLPHSIGPGAPKRRKISYSIPATVRQNNLGVHWPKFLSKKGRCEICSKNGVESRPYSNGDSGTRAARAEPELQNDAEGTPALGLLGLSLSYEMMEGLLLFKF